MNRIDHERTKYLWTDVVDDIGLKTGTAMRLLVRADIQKLQEYIENNKFTIEAELRNAFPGTKKVKYAIAPKAIYNGMVQPGDRFKVLNEFADSYGLHIESLFGHDNPTYIMRYNCAHLDGDDWIIVEREEPVDGEE